MRKSKKLVTPDGLRLYAVIDTNVIVSSFFSLDGSSNPAEVIKAVFEGIVTPLYNDEILEEYKDVLSRAKFPFNSEQIDTIISAFHDLGVETERTPAINETFPDPDDILFYEVAISVKDALLVTGNKKHFPEKSFVITPTELVAIIKKG